MIQSDFGSFLIEKRNARGFTLRHMADILDVSSPYYSDVEKGRRAPMNLEKLERFANATGLSDEDRARMFDLAGWERGGVSPDLIDYVMEHDYVRAALRAARDLGADDADWEAFARRLQSIKNATTT